MNYVYGQKKVDMILNLFSTVVTKNWIQYKIIGEKILFGNTLLIHKRQIEKSSTAAFFSSDTCIYPKTS